MRRSKRVLFFAGGAALGAVMAAVSILGTNSKSPTLCGKMERRVEGLESFQWDNGITASAASWLQVLTDGVTRSSGQDRPLIAEAVANDQAGFDALLAALPKESRPAAQRLRDAAVSPTDPIDSADITMLRELASAKCGLV